MPAERIAMRQVRAVLRLNAAGVPGNEIARRVGVASSTVRLTLKRLADSRLSWPLPTELTDAALEAQLFTAAGKKQGHRRRDEPDWAAVHRELKLSTSRCRSYGTKTSSVIPRGIGIRGSASCTGSGPRAAISCLSITLATRCR